ncbi:MAG: exodeoxyribonuclease III [Bacillota bacterium]|nr:exodeoxyribonuclease III [Bacillota bacterium]
MKLHSWNVNGLRAVIRKGFFDYLSREDPHIVCLQEIKAMPDQVEDTFDGYHVFWNSAQRKGYSGTMTLSKTKPISVRKGIGIEVFDVEGRVLTLEFDDFFLVNIYTPNSKSALERLDERMYFEDELRAFLAELEEEKHVIVCGDLNVAHQEIDLKNPQSNRRSAGFTDEEREKFTQLLESGYIDTFRYFYPDAVDVYSWWSPITRARSRNAGWRIDYFLVSEGMKEKMKDARVLMEVMGSDHCPVELELK